ncbi:MAG: hypothetical protein HY244_07425 [Rhizobiales bacterium]|nr:hypothetical protein [Hyphomicrobiales bacterium]
MRTIAKYALTLAMTGALALAAASPSEARNGRNAAVIGGFAAGALVGAAVAGSYNNGYAYYYGNDYAYEPGYAYAPAPVYSADDYVYAPEYRTRYYRSWGYSRCGGSPGSPSYTPCPY